MPLTIDGQANSITSSTAGVNIPATVDTLSVGPSGSYMIANSSGVGIGTLTPQDKLTVLGRVHIQQDSSSNSRLVFRAKPGNSYRWSIDNDGTSNALRIFREDDVSSTNSVVYMNIDSAGNVRKPLQSFCDTGDTSSWNGAASLTASPASAKGNWSSTTTNVGNNFSTTTDLYTCPVAGAYAISCSCSIDNVTAGRYIFVLSINGGYEEITEIFDTFENQSPCVIRYCNANDTIGLGINGTGSSSLHVRLQVYLLG